LFFTDRGKFYWQKVYDLPLAGRTAKGRALVNLLQLGEEERVSQCLAVKEFDEDHYLIMATRNGLVKKTVLSAYGRPLKGGLIAINLDEDDALIDVRIVSKEDDVLLATREGMCIRFSAEDARAMGRATRGVKGIKLVGEDRVVGMVVAEEEGTLLTVCENGFGKRTPIGPGEVGSEEPEIEDEPHAEPEEIAGDEEVAKYTGNMRYRRQNRGGKGLRDIKTTQRNGKVIDILAVADDDEVLMVTGGGKIQRLRASDISQVGRNTQGVRIIRLDEDDKLVSIARIPADLVDETELAEPVQEEKEEKPPAPPAISEESTTQMDETSSPESEEGEPSA
jgi:DNA gyrase subunit A